MEGEVMDYEEAPGFRFYPTEEELIAFYLRQKLEGRMQEDLDRVIPVLYIYDYNPWHLPQHAGERCRRDPQLGEWFFFIPRREREARGGRPNRLTTDGYWKATGSPGWVYSSNESNRIIGVKRTMVFYQGRARNPRSGPATKTEWKMNEYMVVDPAHQPPSFFPATAVTGDYSVCRVYKKSKCGRAFERRPPAPRTVRSRSIASSDTQAVDHYKQPPTSSNHHENQSPLMVEIVPSSSVENSSPSSGDHAGNNNVNQYIDGDDQENNMDLEMNQAPIWDFDALNWTF